ncbi:ATP-binding protein [Gemmatimonadales bacterium]|nr:ATP-binding protein [Gemmatimonadales bacterium]
MITPTEDEFEEVAPDPSAMIESMRAYGYTLSTAIADLIDNSIAAQAKKIWIRMEWSGPDSWISIGDDGTGMDEESLRSAMRLGTQSPLIERKEDDLGRFGLGLKTASLSQCRRLTVRSVTDGSEVNTRRWDLDYLARPETKGWHLLTAPAEGSEERLEFRSEKSGTVVLWEQLDRLVPETGGEDYHAIEQNWNKLTRGLEEHLALVFHRFLESPRGQGKLQIELNGVDIEPWNPFRADLPATEKVGQENKYFETISSAPVSFEGYVLPHKDRLGSEEHGKLSGPKGWNAQQGFYLYRNRRLIVFGSWLGLGGQRGWTQEEHYKLARIKLDIPNSMDHLWHLDVKKSSASPPPQMKGWLQGLAQNVRKRARETFAHRAKHGPQGASRREITRPWKSTTRAGGRTYRIDRKHEFIQAVKKNIDRSARDELEAALRILEETVPVEQIWLDKAENPEDFNQPFSGTSSRELQKLIQSCYAAIRRNRGCSHDEILSLLRSHQEWSSEEAFAIISALPKETGNG